MIKLENICLSYGGQRVLDNFSLTVPNNGIICLFGPSGCGKTSVARVAAGLTRADSGKVSGIGLGESAFMFQEDRLFPWLTVRENVETVTDGSHADKLLRAGGLEDCGDKYPSELSGGMSRRVSLCRALGYEAKLLILDEPFTGMDAELKQKLYPIIKAYSETKPVLLITHDRDEASSLNAEIIEM